MGGGGGGQGVPIGFGLDHRREDVRCGFAAEGQLAGEHFVEHTAKRPNIGALIDGFALGLLGRHVGGGAQDHAGLGGHAGEGGGIRNVRRGGMVVERLGESEIEHLDHAAVGDLDVGGLEVAMDNAAPVSVLESLANLTGDGQRVVHRKRTGVKALGQGNTFDQLHHQSMGTAGVLKAVNRADIGVIERGQELGFATQAGEPLRIAGEGLGQQLERDLAPEFGIAGAVDLTHATRAQGGDDDEGAQGGASCQSHEFCRRLYQYPACEWGEGRAVKF